MNETGKKLKISHTNNLMELGLVKEDELSEFNKYEYICNSVNIYIF